MTTYIVGACNTCRWSKKGRFIPAKFAKCHHPEIGPRLAEVNPVTGEIDKQTWHWCSTNRMRVGSCGFEGRKWEIKP